jgi:hypothetical protein
MYFASVYYITCGMELELHTVFTLMETILSLHYQLHIWPQFPVSDQVRFNAENSKILERYSKTEYSNFWACHAVPLGEVFPAVRKIVVPSSSGYSRCS